MLHFGAVVVEHILRKGLILKPNLDNYYGITHSQNQKEKMGHLKIFEHKKVGHSKIK